MTLGFPRDLVVELYLPGLGWVDVSSRVRQTHAVTVVRGAMSEDKLVRAGSLKLAFNNPDGYLTPRNPLSAYAGLINKGTPVRASLRVARDTYSRVVVDGFGSTSSGDPYTLDGTAADFDVTGSAGTATIGAANTTRHAYLTGLAGHRAYVVYATMTVPTPGSGTGNFGSVVFRGVTVNDAWRVSVSVGNTGAVELDLVKGVTGELLDFAVVDAVSAGTYRVGLLVDRDSVSSWAWDPATEIEPYSAMVSYDAVIGDLASTGWMGLRARTGSGGGATFTFDDLDVRLPLFAGELADLLPEWSLNHKAKLVSTTATGILDRLENSQQKDQPTAFERWVLGNAVQPFAFWTLDDDELVTLSPPRVGAFPPAKIVDQLDPAPSYAASTPKPGFGRGKLQPWLRSVAEIKDSLVVYCPVDDAGSAFPPGGSWAMHCMIRYQARYSTNIGADQILIGAGLPLNAYWNMVLNPFNGTVQLFQPNGTSVTTVTVLTAVGVDLFDTGAHHLGLKTSQSGGSVTYTLYVDGQVAVTGSVTDTNAAVGRVLFLRNTGADTNYGRSLGYLVVYSGAGPAVADVYDAMLGHVGEASGLRIQRICLEQGWPLATSGNIADTAPMGPQYPIPPLASVREAEAVDGGLLGEQRGLVGLRYDTLDATQNRSAVLALDYSGKQVAPDLQPLSDRQGFVNLYRARRRDGGLFVYELSSGAYGTADPPNGSGVADGSGTFNVEADAQLEALAQRVVARGTVDAARYPEVTVDLRADVVTATVAADVLGLDVGQRMTAANLQPADIYETVDLLVRGVQHVLRDQKRHSASFAGAPYVTNNVFVLDTDRLDGESKLTADLAAGATGTFQATAVGDAWSTAAGDYPADVYVGGVVGLAGERVTVSGVTGTGPTQTFTVTARGVNGFTRLWPTGSSVRPVIDAVLG